jgi:hypothetical protein
MMINNPVHIQAVQFYSGYFILGLVESTDVVSVGMESRLYL